MEYTTCYHSAPKGFSYTISTSTLTGTHLYPMVKRSMRHLLYIGKGCVFEFHPINVPLIFFSQNSGNYWVNSALYMYTHLCKGYPTNFLWFVSDMVSQTLTLIVLLTWELSSGCRQCAIFTRTASRWRPSPSRSTSINSRRCLEQWGQHPMGLRWV